MRHIEMSKEAPKSSICLTTLNYNYENFSEWDRVYLGILPHILYRPAELLPVTYKMSGIGFVSRVTQIKFPLKRNGLPCCEE